MAQQGQVFKLKTRGPGGKPTWAYRYRVDGRRSARPQVGGFASQGEATQALQAALERLHRRNGRLVQITLSELVAEYLAQHEAQPRTIAKLRWLLAKAVCAFGDGRVVELRSDEIAAWRTPRRGAIRQLGTGLGRYRPVVAALGGRSVDVEHPIHRLNSKRK